VLAEFKNNMKQFGKEGIQTTVYCIGFSAYHDAKLLNTLAQSGSNQGNFIYIDTSNENYKEVLQEALGSSLGMAMSSSSRERMSVTNNSGLDKFLKCEKIYAYD